MYRFWQRKSEWDEHFGSRERIFNITNIYFGNINITFGYLDDVYTLCDPEHCQLSFRVASIPGSSIGDYLPCVEPLF